MHLRTCGLLSLLKIGSANRKIEKCRIWSANLLNHLSLQISGLAKINEISASLAQASSLSLS
jgi:hypothetical protein